MSVPARLARPLTAASAGSNPRAARPRPLLADPDSPTRPTISPAETDRSTSRRAFTPPGKLTVRLLASNAGLPAEGSLPASGSTVRRLGNSGAAVRTLPREDSAQGGLQSGRHEVGARRGQLSEQEAIEHR